MDGRVNNNVRQKSQADTGRERERESREVRQGKVVRQECQSE